ncbi:MAG: recombinase family protein, partial [Firmicutes bacterium]|nr:recombinase family protein [Bacillota bacterium]
KIGSAPYGYSVHSGEFTINEDEAKWVRWIFDSAVNGKTCTMIVKGLKEMNVPTSNLVICQEGI